MTHSTMPTEGDLRVWWIPQIPGTPFFVCVQDLEEGRKICDTLAAYDQFQFDHRIKPDYSSTGGVEVHEYGDWASALDENDDDAWPVPDGC